MFRIKLLLYIVLGITCLIPLSVVGSAEALDADHVDSRVSTWSPRHHLIPVSAADDDVRSSPDWKWYGTIHLDTTWTREYFNTEGAVETRLLLAGTADVTLAKGAAAFPCCLNAYEGTADYSLTEDDVNHVGDCTYTTHGVISGGNAEGSVFFREPEPLDTDVLTIKASGPAVQGDMTTTNSCDDEVVTGQMHGQVANNSDLSFTPDRVEGGWVVQGTRTHTAHNDTPGIATDEQVETMTVDLRCDDPCDQAAASADFTSKSGATNRVDFTADSVTGATYSWDFGDGTAGSGRTPQHIYAKPGEYDVTLTVSVGGAQSSTTHTVTANPVVTYAPTVVLHPDEERYPYNPTSFVENSDLEWSHDDGCPDDTIDKTPSASRLGSGGYKHWTARADKCQHRTKTYNSAQNTAPAHDNSSTNVFPSGEKKEGFYLDLDNDYYNGTKSMSKVPMYFEFKSGKYVAYWLFYAFNHWKGTRATAWVDERHEGDWEHVVIHLTDTSTASDIAFYEHYCQPTIKSWNAQRGGYGENTGLDDGTHPFVFAAKGGHASYWKPGTFKNADGQTPCGANGKKEMVADQTAFSSKKWRPWDGAGLRDARRADWYGFGGAWGRVGVGKVLGIKTYSTGIPGPSKYKFYDPKVNVVPPAWQ